MERNSAEIEAESQEGAEIIEKIDQKMLDEYNEEIRTVYREIDRSSSLLWSHDNSLIRPKRRSVKRDSKNGNDAQNDDKWKTESNAQLGYGEITKGALQDLYHILQNIDKVIPDSEEDVLTGTRESYRLTQDSTFIDIGSGFGKPVFHAAMQVGCASKGVEIVPARIEFCVDYVFEYEDKNKNRIAQYDKMIQELEAKKSKGRLTPSKAKREPKRPSTSTCNPLFVEQANPLSIEEQKVVPIEEDKQEPKRSDAICGKRRRASNEWSGRTVDALLADLGSDLHPNFTILWYRKVTFQQCDAGKVSKLQMCNSQGDLVDISHIYSYNKVMGKDCLKGIANSLNNTNFKILAWYVNERATCKLVKNVKLLFKKPMQSTGKEKFSVYVYYKIKDETNEKPDGDSVKSKDLLDGS